MDSPFLTKLKDNYSIILITEINRIIILKGLIKIINNLEEGAGRKGQEEDKRD